MSAGPLEGLFREVVQRPVAMSMVFMATIVFGYVSYQRLPVELMPDLAYPTVTVRTSYDGAAPQEVETQVSRPVEEALATLDSLVSIESRSRADTSDVVLGFDWGTDMSAASQRIRESLQTTFLPDGTERPLVLRYDPSLDPFLRLALSFDPDAVKDAADQERTLFLLRHIAEDELKRDLEAMKGVAAVRVRGGLEREVRVEVEETWLAARRLTLEQVQSAIASDNINLAGGSIYEGDTEFLVRTLNEVATLAELRELKIQRSDGVLVPLTDVARVIETHKERQVISRLDGVEAVELEIFKEADANVVQVAQGVKERLFGDGRMDEGLMGDLPEGVVLEALDDQAAFIESAVDNLRDTALLGGLFSVLILFLFLRDFRATAIVGLAIPVSVVVGFSPLYLWDVSLNLMSLGGLALGVGMLVDNAVVVLESIQRYREEGMSRVDASVRGAADVSAAVVASTLTTVAVFLPIGFVEGVGGELFGDLSLAVVGALLASLAVALFLVPTLAALEPGAMIGTLAPEGVYASLEGVGGPRSFSSALFGAWKEALVAPRAGFAEGRAWTRERLWRRLLLPWFLVRFLTEAVWALGLASFVVFTALVGRIVAAIGRAVLRPLAALALAFADRFQAVYGVFARRFDGTVGGVLARPSSVVLIAVVLFLVSLQAVGWLGTELLPEVHQGRFVADVALPVGTPLEVTAETLAAAERRLRAHPDVSLVYATIGADGRADSRPDEGPNTARIRIQLQGRGDLEALEERVMEQVRRDLVEIPRLEVKLSRPALFSVRTPVEVVITGQDLDALRAGGDQVAAALSRVPALRDVRSSLQAGHPEIRVLYDRERLARFGLDTATAARQVRDRVQGVQATELHRGEQRLDLRVQLDEDDRSSLEALRRLNVNPQVVPPIPLDAVADFAEAIGPSEIRRVDQQRAVVVSANLEGFDLGAASGDIAASLKRLTLPAELEWSIAGQSREMSESFASMRFALLLAVFLVYVIMASTFESLVHPFVILLSVPMAFVGVAIGLGVAAMPLSVVVFIGLIVLAGVVVNNAIVLVDTINRLRDDGMDRTDAIRRASALRLRPILITSATTVLGLLPLSMGYGAGAEIQQPLAVTVIGGLSSSTLLTLVVVPAIYSLFTRVGTQPVAVVDPDAEPVA